MNEKYNLKQNLKGKLITGIPFLKVKLKNVELPEQFLYYKKGIDAIFDTGANNTHITPNFAKILGLKSIRKDFGRYIVENGHSESNVYELNFKINGIDYNFKEEFKELPYEFNYPIIFGTRFLLKCEELKMDFIKEEYFLKI
jgi:hypothetical protein